ncbi:MAG TPA: enoyl-CoA hydratase/isomerase family protein [Steroidobacteraceae bacterium]|nr:enoyl-CoA hydratase/isomerase family protein [Steroidobacteraceae bacterium]
MNIPQNLTTVGVSLDHHVAIVELRRPPHNFFDAQMIGDIAAAYEALDAIDECRAIVLAAQGKSFCAGANFGGNDASAEIGKRDESVAALYREAVRLFRTGKPIVAAIHGPAIGGGLGVALSADFRVTCAEATFSANFTRLGFHPGFGLTVTLPELIGRNPAALLFYTGRRVKGDEAVRLGLADSLVPQDRVRDAAVELAREIAAAAPLAVIATRATFRLGLADRVAAATDRELIAQSRLRITEDFQEGTRASSERREPQFKGR